MLVDDRKSSSKQGRERTWLDGTSNAVTGSREALAGLLGGGLLGVGGHCEDVRWRTEVGCGQVSILFSAAWSPRPLRMESDMLIVCEWLVEGLEVVVVVG